MASDTTERILPTDKERLYFTKDGRTKFSPKAPSAFAWGYPWPPCPTNLNKNRVFRPKEEEIEQVEEEVKEEFIKESKPLDIPEKEGNLMTSRMRVPDIELALYWDRHPYEFRSNLYRRAKSAMNLSTLSELIQSESPCNIEKAEIDNQSKSGESSTLNGSRRSSSNDSKKSRTSSSGPQIRNYKPMPIEDKDKNDNQNLSNGNHNNSKSKSLSPSKEKIKFSQKLKHESKNSSSNNKVPKILHLLNTNEKRIFDDISKRQSKSAKDKGYRRPQAVREVHSTHNNTSSIGVQATFDEISAAALKSTYLCPLHGQYNQGKERRAKSGFRTDMSSTLNPHARCSRSRTKFIKDSEMQTDINGGIDNNLSKSITANKHDKGRSKTAGPRLQGRGNMLSEYNGNFRNPAKIFDAENRRLKNKILSYCFTKHSIF